MPVVDLALAAGDPEPKIGALGDDAHLLGPVEALGDPLHLPSFRVPVEEARAEDELLVLGQRHPGVLRAGGGRVLADHPGDLERAAAPCRRLVPLAKRRLALRRQVGAVAGVLRRDDRDPRILGLEGVHLDRRHRPEQLEWGLGGPDEVVGEALEPVREAHERVGAAPGDPTGHLLDQWPRERARAHGHLPARLDAQAALDQEPRVLADLGRIA